MAYVKLNWDYGDTTTIVGFRVYRDGELRAELDRLIQTYDDDTTSYQPTQANYKVVAYDIFGKESLACTGVTVQLVQYLIPMMTGQNTPSGEALAKLGPTATSYTYSVEGFHYFNINYPNLYFKTFGGHVRMQVDQEVYYTWEQPVVIEQWGWIEYRSGNVVYENFLLFGTNNIAGNVDDSSIWEEIGRIHETNDDYANGTRIIKNTTNNGKEYMKIKAVFKGLSPSSHYEPIQKMSELLILGRP